MTNDSCCGIELYNILASKLISGGRYSVTRSDLSFTIDMPNSCVFLRHKDEYITSKCFFKLSRFLGY